MADVEITSKIKRETLNCENYVQSLLEQAYLEHLLSDIELEQIQLDCLALLSKLTERFNNGNSSSIRVEKAQDILLSTMFTVGVYLKTFLPDEAVAMLQKDGIESAYTQGRKRIDRLIKQTKMRHYALVGRLLPTKNTFYNDTIVGGIMGFFKLYNPEFTAHEIHITADYPVYNKTERLLGIEFIAQYLDQLYYENAFCTHFTADNIHRLLRRYDACYEDLLFNLYEPILTTALGCSIAGTDAAELVITSAVQGYLCRQFDGKDTAQIAKMLAYALVQLGENLSFSENLMKYVSRSLPQLAAVIESRAKSCTLDQMFLAGI